LNFHSECHYKYFSDGWFNSRRNKYATSKFEWYVFSIIYGYWIEIDFVVARDPRQLFEMLRSNPEMLQQVRQSSPQIADAIQRGDLSMGKSSSN
jgi:hypothetical protein